MNLYSLNFTVMCPGDRDGGYGGGSRSYGRGGGGGGYGGGRDGGLFKISAKHPNFGLYVSCMKFQIPIQVTVEAGAEAVEVTAVGRAATEAAAVIKSR